MPSSRISAPEVVARAAAMGSIAARQPRKMKNSAISRTGRAIASPRSRSFWPATIPSLFTPRSPPTCTRAPGTAWRAAARIASTAIIWACMGTFLRTDTTIRLARPSGARSMGSLLV